MSNIIKYWSLETRICFSSMIDILNEINEEFYKNIYHIYNDIRLINTDKLNIGEKIINIYYNIKIKITEFEYKLDQQSYIWNNCKTPKKIDDFEKNINEIIEYIDNALIIIKRFNSETFMSNDLNISYKKQLLKDIINNLEKYKDSQNLKLYKKISNILYSKNDEIKLRKILKNYKIKIKFCEKYILLIRDYISNLNKISINEIYDLKQKLIVIFN